MGGSTSKAEEKPEKVMSTSISTRGSYEREVVVYGKEDAVAEAKWRRERRRLKEEVRRLKEEMQGMKKKATEEEKEKEKDKDEGLGWEWVVEQMCVERALRDEAVERWKQLYLSIKTELDHLIHRTYGEGLYCGTREEETKMMEELRQELKVREGIIEKLKKQTELLERDKYEKEREIDILRQSLRIIGNGHGQKMMKTTTRKRVPAAASKNLPVFTNKCICSN